MVVSFFLSFFQSFFLTFLIFLVSNLSYFRNVFIFLVPEIRDENGNFLWFPKIGGEKGLGTIFTRILGAVEK